MRERTTFIHGSDDAFDPNQLRIENDALKVSNLRAAREDRLTFGFQELPQEIWRALKQCHELHIRWSAPGQFDTISPFNSHTSPGLSIFYTPHKKNQSPDLLCPLLHKIFDPNLKCTTPAETFTPIQILSGRFSSSSSHQYHALLPSLKNLHTYVTQKICSSHGPTCTQRADALLSANNFDIDWDAVSQSLVLRTLRPTTTWTTSLCSIGSSKLEVGVLSAQPPEEPEELKLGGFLVVVGEDTKPSPALFSFPARHHSLPLSSSWYKVSFAHPTGLHPTMKVTLPADLTRPNADNCKLHAYLTLPSYLFPDKYQLSSSLFLASKNLDSLVVVDGYTDLEAPDWAASKWGSAMLLSLAPPSSTIGNWTAEIPLHLRYLAPNAAGQEPISVPWPVIFWACTAESGTKMSVNPFDRVNLGYDGLFGARTMFYHLSPQKPSIDEVLSSLDAPDVGPDYSKVLRKWFSAKSKSDPNFITNLRESGALFDAKFLEDLKKALKPELEEAIKDASGGDRDFEKGAVAVLFDKLKADGQKSWQELSPKSVLIEAISVPVLDTTKTGGMEGITAAVILTGFLFVLWRLSFFLTSSSGRKELEKKKQ